VARGLDFVEHFSVLRRDSFRRKVSVRHAGRNAGTAR
jgi:hypothetical protein